MMIVLQPRVVVLVLVLSGAMGGCILDPASFEASQAGDVGGEDVDDVGEDVEVGDGGDVDQGLQCGQGEAVCSVDDQEEVCVDVESDADHCGGCGQVCRSGDCQGGQCQPFACESGGAPFGGGSGSLEDPYRICSPQQLMAIGDGAGDLQRHFVMSADVNLAELGGGREIAQLSTLARPFEGSFDGFGFEIANLVLESGLDYAGLFGSIGFDGVIKDLSLRDAVVSGGVNVGILVGQNHGRLERVHVEGLVEGRSHVGGLVGSNLGGEVLGCSAAGSVTGSQQLIGGLVGYNYGWIGDSTATNTVKGTHFVGGLVGDNFDLIEGSVATGAVESTDNPGASMQADAAGGLVGRNLWSARILDSGAEGGVQGQAINSGGLVGVNFGLIRGGWADGEVMSQRRHVGGLVGWMGEWGRVESSNATVNVIAHAAVAGGLVGDMVGDSFVVDSYAHGRVTAHQELAGGLVGRMLDRARVSRSYATGRVEGVSNGQVIGGLVGRLNGNSQVEESYARGAVEGIRLVGGLAGDIRAEARISRSFAKGSVTGDQEVGGLVGSVVEQAEVVDSYATGAVLGDSNNETGGFVGTISDVGAVRKSYSVGQVTAGDSTSRGFVGRVEDEGIVHACYFDLVRSGHESGGALGVQGLSAAEFAEVLSFSGWDFIEIWTMQGGAEGEDVRPRLRWDQDSQ